MTMPNSQLVMFAGNNVETVEEVRSMQLAVRCDALKANSSSERKSSNHWSFGWKSKLTLRLLDFNI